MGIAFAVSLATGMLEGNYLPAAEFAARLRVKYLRAASPRILFSTSMYPIFLDPTTAPVITRQGKRRYEDS
jgi:hypothetical protein